jgi:DNA-binding winged helix-turn-helix (wHTH) protein
MADHTFRIGDWLVLPDENRLRQSDSSVEIEPKMMAVLVALANRRGGVASREELYQVVWPDVIVGGDALNRCITQLRKVLGDDARNPRYIETISRRGYRLLGRVEPLATDRSENVPAAHVESRILSRGWLGHRAEMIVARCTLSKWSLIAARMRFDDLRDNPNVDQVIEGIGLHARATALDRPGVHVDLKTRSLLAAAPLVGGLLGFVIATLAVYGNVAHWGVATAIVLAATALGAVAGAPIRLKALSASRQALAGFVAAVTGNLSAMGAPE